MAGYIGNFPTAIPLSGNDIADGTITNSDLANSSLTVNGTTISLGGSETITAGKIGQVVQATSTANQTTSSSSFVAVSGMSLSITPTSASSKIYLTAMQVLGIGLGGGYAMRVSIFRDGTNLNGNDNGLASFGTDASGTNVTTPIIYLDSPSTTSAITYQVYFRSVGGATVSYNNYSGATATLIAMEVLA